MNLGLYSYLSAAIAFGFFAILLLFSWRGSLQGRLLTITAMINAIWAGLAAEIAADNVSWIGAYQIFELLRYVAWYLFLLKLFQSASTRSVGYRNFLRWALPLSAGFVILLLIAELFSDYLLTLIPEYDPAALDITGHVFLAIIGLAILEQLFRNTAVRHRWAIKYLLAGTGGIFAFDFYLYSDALLFRGMNQALWAARGVVNLMAVPLLTVAAARNKNWSLNVFVSRDIVLNTTAIFGSGLYLLAMAGAGYYFKEHGGSWSRLAQVIFFSLALILLAAVMFSGQLRAQIRVFLGKHFYRNKYDYRHEWLILTRALNDSARGEDKPEKAVIKVLANIVDARAGMLWLRNERNSYTNVAVWNIHRSNKVVQSDSALIRFLNDKAYVINLLELESRAEEYEGLDLPGWLVAENRLWLIIPLISQDALMGYVILSNPLLVRSINWEDRDLLKTAANQVTSYLSALITSEELAKAKQFEVFNRLSAYMVHDLKNIAAELELIGRNADKHKGNPEFLDDAFETVANASSEIKRLLDQLRNKRIQTGKKTAIDLGVLIREVMEKKRDQRPCPILDSLCEGCFVVAERDRLMNVLTHIIDNAQQASEDSGFVRITVGQEDSMHVIRIMDNGHGMDEDFIRNRLFRPFDTTKGNAGMGIGMYESREFIRQLGGDIHVESKPGKGTLISLRVPAAVADL